LYVKGYLPLTLISASKHALSTTTQHLLDTATVKQAPPPDSARDFYSHFYRGKCISRQVNKY